MKFFCYYKDDALLYMINPAQISCVSVPDRIVFMGDKAHFNMDTVAFTSFTAYMVREGLL